jgi:hypothetical protein
MNTTIVIYAVLIALTAGGLLVVTTGGFSGIGVAEGALSSSRSYGDPNQIGAHMYTEIPTNVPLADS